jgi:hypothetical protein
LVVPCPKQAHAHGKTNPAPEGERTAPNSNVTSTSTHAAHKESSQKEKKSLSCCALLLFILTRFSQWMFGWSLQKPMLMRIEPPSDECASNSATRARASL